MTELSYSHSYSFVLQSPASEALYTIPTLYPELLENFYCAPVLDAPLQQLFYYCHLYTFSAFYADLIIHLLKKGSFVKWGRRWLSGRAPSVHVQHLMRAVKTIM